MNIKLRKADVEFSKYIRTRDGWRCVACGTQYQPPTQGLQNSHFWGRGRENTRFDPDNCDALCFSCHQYWGGDGREEYIAFKIKQLGDRNYKKLKIRAFQYRKKDDKLALLAIKQLMNDLTRTDNQGSRTGAVGA
jgi:hypothetical protein